MAQIAAGKGHGPTPFMTAKVAPAECGLAQQRDDAGPRPPRRNRPREPERSDGQGEDLADAALH